MYNVIEKWIVRRQIKATAKPPDGVSVITLGGEKAKICMRGWNVWIMRMQHERHPHCLKPFAGELRAALCGRRRHLITEHMRKTDTRLLENLAIR